MGVITKVSDILPADIAEYMRLTEPTTEELTTIATMYNVAVEYILKYTGIKDKAILDNYEDMVIVVYVLCQDMYDNRALYVDNANLNRVVETILGMHQVNLL